LPGTRGSDSRERRGAQPPYGRCVSVRRIITTVVRISILGSGSGGNCTLVSTERTHVLIDAGFSRRETLKRLALAGESIDAVDAILISHEHTDHINGLPRLASQWKSPVFLNARTRLALGATGEELPRVEPFVVGQTFTVGDITINSFTIPHDAADPVGFTFEAEGIKIALVTDLGYMPENVRDAVRGAHCLILESNHDLEMLKLGPYPWSLKQRVLSRVGHLSNDGLAEFLQGDFDGAAAHLVLAHLSENNNLPEVALLSAQQALERRPTPPQVQVAPQDRPLASIVF